MDKIQVGLRIIIQQRLHEQDLTGYLLEKNPEDYTHICLPAEASEHVSPETLKAFYQEGLLDPVRFPKPELEKLKRTLGSTAYSEQYGQNPVPSDGLIFKRDWFPVLSMDQFRDLLGTRIVPVNIVVDSAYTNNPDNDPSALMAYYKFDNHIYVKNVAVKWLEFKELVKYIIEFALDNGVTSQSRVYVEEAASGKSLIQHINKSNRNLNVIGIPKPRLSKEKRAFSITPDTEAKKVQLIQGIYTNDFLNEVCVFPKAKHDDRVDCLLHEVEKFLKHTGEWDFRFS